MIPGWKLRREFKRLGQQLRAIPEAMTEPIAQARHDRVVFPAIGHEDGQVALGPKVAIYLIYQPKGVAESTAYTCGFLAQKGYSVLLISNAPLKTEDRARLAPHVWRFVERPNFGYDFGGYRDGIRLLWKWEVAPATLFILNDSVWFPLDPETTFMEDIEAHPADVAGAILRGRGEERFLESYIYRIRGALLSAPAFRTYWDTLRLTSNKYKVIRRGERGFSRAMIAAGYRVAGLCPNEELPRHLEDVDDAFLREMLEHAAYIDRDLAEDRDRLLSEGGPGWREAVIDHVRRTLVKRQAYSSFPLAMMRLGYPFLKKSHDEVASAWQSGVFTASQAGLVELPRPLMAELRTYGNCAGAPGATGLFPSRRTP